MEESPDSNAVIPATTTVVVSANRNCVLLQTAQAKVFNNVLQRDTKIRLLLDNGSQQSFISASLKDALQLKPIKKEYLGVTAFASQREDIQNLEVVELEVKNSNNAVVSKVKLFVVPMICAPIRNQVIDIARENFDVLRNINLADSSAATTNLEIGVLIGSNFYWDFVTGRTIQVAKGLKAVHTSLGWVLNGNVMIESEASTNLVTTNTAHVLSVSCEEREESRVSVVLEKFWEVESYGTTEVQDFDLKNFSSKVWFDGERYSLPLPWKRDTALKIPDNKSQCMKRLSSLLQRLKSKSVICHIIASSEKIR